MKPPPSFLPTPGTPVVLWSEWERAFENYLVVSEKDKATSNVKKALLLHCVGLEAQRIFYCLNDGTTVRNNESLCKTESSSTATKTSAPGTSTTVTTAPDTSADIYTDSLCILRNHFARKCSVMAERFYFRRRRQHGGENIEDFVTALMGMVTRCKFGMLQDEMIRDQVVEACSSEDIRERILMEEDPTLDQVMKIAKRMEMSTREAKSLATDGSFRGDVQQIRVKNSAVQKKRVRKCFKCGSESHLANDLNCPARNSKCNFCSGIGHWERVCKNKDSGKRVYHVVELSSDETTSANEETEIIKEIEEVFEVNSTSTAIKVTVEINHVPILFVVDTASGKTLLSYNLFMEHFGNQQLLCYGYGKLISYTKHAIDIKGIFYANICYKERKMNNVPIYVTEGQSLLGRNVIQGLGLNIDGEFLKVMSIVTTDQEGHSDVNDHFDKLLGVDVFPAIKGFVHRVEINMGIKPVQQKVRRIPYAIRGKVAAELSRLENVGIIEKIDASEWVSPMVVVTKKNGGVRICLDLRKVNEAVIPDRFMLPKTEEIFHKFRNAKYFSCLDLKSAYHQMTLHTKSRNLTAFVTEEGLWRYTRVCFGLASAPAAFQKMMTKIISGLDGVECYLDDVIIYGSSEHEHDIRLNKALSRLEGYGVQLNKDKCIFKQTEIHFLGHRISLNSITVGDKIKAIEEAATPIDLPTLRSFLGLAGYFSNHVPNFTDLVEPLRKLSRIPTKFDWTDEHSNCFNDVKCALANSTKLTPFDPSLETVLTTDASGYGISGVLSQMKNGEETIVSCVSRTLSTIERGYSVGEREALACVWATEKFHTYLWGRRFILKTDHLALTTLLKKGVDRQSMRIARWACRLYRYDFKIEYVKGKDNKVADALSRLPVTGSQSAGEDDDEVAICQILDTAMSLPRLTKATQADDLLCRIMNYVSNGWPAKAKLGPGELNFYHVKEELSVSNELLLRGMRIAVPTELRADVINLAHEGHQGIVRTKQRLRDGYYWPGMDKETESAIYSCAMCQNNDKTVKTFFSPLTPVEVPPSPWIKLAVDVVGPFDLAPAQYRYAITLIDFYSKWPEVKFVSHVTTNTITLFLKEIFNREGLPFELVSDNASQFTSYEFQEFLNEHGIKHVKSSPYYPQANGAIERFHRVLKGFVQDAYHSHQNWARYVSDCLSVYRATKHATTGKSPSLLLHGRELRTKLAPVAVKISANSDETMKHIKLSQQKYKLYADAKRPTKLRFLDFGDSVRVKEPKIVKKGENKYLSPVKIMGQVGPNTYMTEHGDKVNISRLSVVKPQVAKDNADDSSNGGRPIVGPSTRPQRTRRMPNHLKDYILY